MRPFLKFKGHAIVIAGTLLWLCGVVVGFRELLRYSNTPGAAAQSSQWPRDAALQPARDRATLIAFAHPQCPCTSATLGELALIMARSRGKLDAYVYFYAPRSLGSEWARTKLWRQAESIPGVRPIEDRDGGEALRFGASTSGQTLLYDLSGRLVFKGGITAARGHAGANHGRDAVLSLVENGKAARNASLTFGCSLRGQA
jgi:hypothetical protein